MPRPRKDCHADVLLPDPDEQGRRLITGTLAALVVGTTPRTVRKWREDGLLTAAGQEPAGRRQLIYDYADVIAADARARGIACLSASR